jgi:hypothetical protein
MPGYRSTINIKAATSAETHDEAHRFPFIERLLRIGRACDQEQKTNNQHLREKLHNLPFRKLAIEQFTNHGEIMRGQ